jgi:hypothetical protein
LHHYRYCRAKRELRPRICKTMKTPRSAVDSASLRQWRTPSPWRHWIVPIWVVLATAFFVVVMVNKHFHFHYHVWMLMLPIAKATM